MRRKYILIVLSLAACLVLGQAALAQVATIRLTGGGAWAGLNDFGVPDGSTVPLVLEATGIENLSDWQVNLEITGPASPLTLGSHDTWWETQSNVVDNDLVPQSMTQTYILLGSIDFFNAPPWSHSSPDTVSLANLEFDCEGLGDVTVRLITDGALTTPVFSKAHPTAGPDLGDLELPVEFSDTVVTIHQGVVSEPVWSVAPSDEFGFIEMDEDPLQGTLTLSALPKDEDVYFFKTWTQDPSGAVVIDPGSPTITIPSTVGVELVAHFGMIPEPVSATLLGLGLACLGLRRRRGRRA